MRDGEELGPYGTLWTQNPAVAIVDFSVTWANTIYFTLTGSVIVIINIFFQKL